MCGGVCVWRRKVGTGQHCVVALHSRLIHTAASRGQGAAAVLPCVHRYVLTCDSLGSIIRVLEPSPQGAVATVRKAGCKQSIPRQQRGEGTRHHVFDTTAGAGAEFYRFNQSTCRRKAVHMQNLVVRDSCCCCCSLATAPQVVQPPLSSHELTISTRHCASARCS